ncbi:MAG: hypothetical protein WC718_04990, partial [Phycisphaerales bacterium]
SHTLVNYQNNFDHTGAQTVWTVDFPGPPITNCSLAGESGEVFAIAPASYTPPGGTLDHRNVLTVFFNGGAHAIAREGEVFTNPRSNQEMSISYFQTVSGLTDYRSSGVFLAGIASSPPVTPDDTHLALFAASGVIADQPRLIAEVGDTFEDQLNTGHYYTIESFEASIFNIGDVSAQAEGYAVCKCVIRDADVPNSSTMFGVLRFSLDGLSGTSIIVKDGDSVQGLAGDYHLNLFSGFEISGTSPAGNILFYGFIGNDSGQRSAALVWSPFVDGSYDPYNHEGVRAVAVSGDSIDLVVNGVVTPQTVNAIASPNTSTIGSANGGSGRASPINDFGDAIIGGNCRDTSMPSGVVRAFWALYRNCKPVPTCDYLPDGNIDAGDVDALISIVAGNVPFGRCPPDPDYNVDGNVDSGDVDSLIDALASGTCP